MAVCSAADDVAARSRRSRVLRPPARPLHALLHRDVGALQLLRDAGVPHPLHDGAGAAGGLGFDDADAASIYGTYTASVYVARRCLAAGSPIASSASTAPCSSAASLIALGHFTLAFQSLPFFYSGLALIVLGTGLLKPNVSTLVGIALRDRATRVATRASRSSTWASTSARSSGRSIAGYLAQRVDWHIGFASAGVGMTLGLIQYVLGRQRLWPTRTRASRRRRSAGRRRAGRACRRDGPRAASADATEWKRMRRRS